MLFGLARSVCGDNDHPDSTQFGYVFRLLSTYSLIKPIKGSTIAGSEMLTTLVSYTDYEDTIEGRQKWLKVMDDVIEGKPRAQPQEQTQEETQGETQEKNNQETRLNKDALDNDEIFKIMNGYVAGYIVRNCHKWTKCQECLR